MPFHCCFIQLDIIIRTEIVKWIVCSGYSFSLGHDEMEFDGISSMCLCSITAGAILLMKCFYTSHFNFYELYNNPIPIGCFRNSPIWFKQATKYIHKSEIFNKILYVFVCSTSNKSTQTYRIEFIDGWIS